MAKVNFDEASHEYTVGGVTYISTTQLLKKYGLNVDYTGISDAVLKKAANKGKAVHKGLEQYILGNKNVASLIPEVGLFENYIKLRGIDLSTAKAEEMLVDDTYKIAGTIDFQYDDDGPCLTDFKTTSTLHIDVVAWQLSIYCYLAVKGDIVQYYFKKLKAFHFTAGRLYVKDIYTIEYDQVVALLKAQQANAPTFNYTRVNQTVTPTQELYIKQLLYEIKGAEDQAKHLKAELTKQLAIVKKGFEKNKEYSYRKDDLSLKYTEASVTERLDQKKAKEYIEKQPGVNIKDFMSVTKNGAKVSATIVKPKPTTPKKRKP